MFDSLILDTNDYKTQLQEITQANSESKLEYKIIKREGPPHNPMFTASVLLNDIVLGKGTAKTKKEAENLAAQDAIDKLV